MEKMEYLEVGDTGTWDHPDGQYRVEILDLFVQGNDWMAEVTVLSGPFTGKQVVAFDCDLFV